MFQRNLLQIHFQIDLRRLFGLAAHHLEDTLVVVRAQNSSVEQIVKNQFTTVFTDLGLCYTYYLPNHMIYSSGVGTGITFHLNIDHDEYYFSEIYPGNIGFKVGSQNFV